ncbi:MAG: luciferase family protein [Chloroflexota bacterium]
MDESTATNTPGIANQIRSAVESWDGVSSHSHRFGGVEFRAGGRELGHLHGDELADLLLPKRVHDQVISDGRARPHHVLPQSNWVSVYLHDPAQVQDVVDLLRAAYERAVTHPVSDREAEQEPERSSSSADDPEKG